jgi:methylmalonyl-CoA/ethylmalonyl-CoA epimerase
VGVATPSIEASTAFYRDVIGAGVIREPFEVSTRCMVATFTL